MELSHDETERNYIEFFGEDDGRTVHIITNSISQLYQEWRLFLYFFTGPKERVEVLNVASGTTARTIQNLLWDSALMKVRRLTDPARSRSNRNLCIQKLVQIAQESCSADLSVSYEDVLGKVKTCRKYTDKHLVHRDLSHALGKAETSIDRKATTEAIRSIGGFIKKFHLITRDTEYLLMPMSGIEDEQQFLMRLYLGNERAIHLEKERYERAMAGELTDFSEYERPEWIVEQKMQTPSFDFD